MLTVLLRQMHALSQHTTQLSLREKAMLQSVLHPVCGMLEEMLVQGVRFISFTLQGMGQTHNITCCNLRGVTCNLTGVTLVVLFVTCCNL